MYHLWNHPNLYDNTELGQEEMRALEAMRSFAEVVACTAPLEGHIQGKYKWRRRHFKKGSIVITHDKSLIRGDILVDDAIHNITAFPGSTIIYTQPWNMHHDSINGSSRVESFSQIPQVALDILTAASAT